MCLVMSIQMSSLDDHFSYYENVELNGRNKVRGGSNIIRG